MVLERDRQTEELSNQSRRSFRKKRRMLVYRTPRSHIVFSSRYMRSEIFPQRGEDLPVEESEELTP